MGCCQSSGARSPVSTPASTFATPAPPRPSISATSDPPSLPPPFTTTSPTGRRRNLDPCRTINKPLRPHKWGNGASGSSARHTRPQQEWTRSALEKHREEFFDTRVTGHPEIWLTLRSVAEITQSSLANQAAGRQGSGDRGHRLALHLPGGRHKDEGGTLGSELATAQSMLDAAGITLPSGDLADGVYDESGGYYQLPAEIIADPPGLIEDRPPPVNSLMSSSTIGTDGRESTSSLVEPDQPRKGSPKPTARGEKAAGLLSPAGAIGSPVEPASPAEERLFVKMRLSERGGKDLGIRIEKSRPVGELIKMMREEAKLSADIKIRLAYSGRILQEHQSLVSQGWKEGHVVNAMVFAGD